MKFISYSHLFMFLIVAIFKVNIFFTQICDYLFLQFSTFLLGHDWRDIMILESKFSIWKQHQALSF